MLHWYHWALLFALVIFSWIAVSTYFGRKQDRARKLTVTRRPDNDLYARVAKSIMPEVTSTRTFCPLCDGPDGVHAYDCPRRILDEMATRKIGKSPLLAMPYDDDDGEPLPAAMTAQPNIGGLDHPPYEGPHYESVHGLPDRFVCYDVIGEPLPGTAVTMIGGSAVVGPIGEIADAEPDDIVPDRT